jgi:hypothetical protein
MIVPITAQVLLLHFLNPAILTRRASGGKTKTMIPPRHPLSELHPACILIKIITVIIGTNDNINPAFPIKLLCLVIL